MNLRPSGYEFDRKENLNNHTITINKVFCSTVSELDTKNQTKYSHFIKFFCQAVKSLTRKNCTNNCTDTKLKKNSEFLLRGWNYTNVIIKTNLINFTFTIIFTTSRLISRLNYMQVVKHISLKIVGLLYLSRLHDLFFYILVFKKFYLLKIFFLKLIEKFDCEVVNFIKKYLFMVVQSSRLKILSCEISREVVKGKK